MSVKFNFKIESTAESSPFLQPLQMKIGIKSLEQTLTEYELEHGFHPAQSTRELVPSLLEVQIRHDTGLTGLSVSRFFFNQDKYLIKFSDNENYLMFKLIYYGTNV